MKFWNFDFVSTVYGYFALLSQNSLRRTSLLLTSHKSSAFSIYFWEGGEETCELQEDYQDIGEIPGIAVVMTLSAKVQQAKQRGADFYKSQNYSQSIEEYSIAIDNGDINDDELHLYYR